MLKKGDTLLFVSKDMGGAHVGIPLAKLAQKAGYNVMLVAEGLVAPRYEEAGFRPYFKGAVNFSKGNFRSGAKKVIEKLKPVIVVTTLGVPINLEQEYGLAANDLGIPLVFLEDYWGAHVRSQAKPNLVLLIDEIAAESARLKYNSTTQIAVVGNYAVSNALNLEIPDELRKKVEDLRKKFGQVLVFTAGGVHVSSQILLLAECLKKTPDWVLIPRFHPKSVDLIGPSGKTFGEEWRGLFKEFGEKVVYIQSKTTEPLVALADATLSDFSTLLTTALVFGHSAVSIATAGVRETMKNETGFTSHPLVETGLVKEIIKPCNLVDYLSKPDLEIKARYLRPYEPKKALQAIEVL
ncbi:MAG: hypothetical protein A3F96_02530 [Parcubacteria group bacterium RIFCSPLOWO2_12_FULL_40_10]|nr:MAG: hypothetical protein A3F96_02530 [Parcubacteria group bacterium RIFCSPLOWO2_12_FULL_40_10]